jgi:hypothetical protein
MKEFITKKKEQKHKPRPMRQSNPQQEGENETPTI